MPSALAETALPASDRVEPSADNPAGPHEEPEGAADERLCLVRLTDSLTRGVWPTYARLACALNLLALRAMHAQLCGTLGRLPCRRNFRARAPLAARVCGNVPFHPAREGGEAVGAQLAVHPEVGGLARTGEGHVVGSGSSAPSSTFYSAFLHPLYVWAQCLDRQFYAQVRCLLRFVLLYRGRLWRVGGWLGCAWQDLCRVNFFVWEGRQTLERSIARLGRLCPTCLLCSVW